MSVDGAQRLLDGWRIEVAEAAHAPLSAAAAVLGGFGAELHRTPARDDRLDRLRVCVPGGGHTEARLVSWPVTPRLDARAGSVVTACAALRLAGAAVLAARRRRPELRLSARAVASEMGAGIQLSGGRRPELVRCRDGWVVARFREPAERELLRALVGDPAERARTDVVAHARLARLLVAPVQPPPACVPSLHLGEGALHERPAAARRRLPVTRRRPRVIDWTVLWAGPWTADQLRRGGSVVHRVEHPRRRDGLLSWPEGRRLWRALNAHKPLALLDAHHAYDRRQLEAAIAGSDVLITSMTPRACRSLGFDDSWREAQAPHLLHIELVAFDAPWADSPGLGEHAAAQAGLLWRDGAVPAQPAPWADPLLGAAALTFAQAWLASTQRPAGRVRFSLEAAARLVFAIPRAQSGIE